MKIIKDSTYYQKVLLFINLDKKQTTIHCFKYSVHNYSSVLTKSARIEDTSKNENQTVKQAILEIDFETIL